MRTNTTLSRLIIVIAAFSIAAISIVSCKKEEPAPTTPTPPTSQDCMDQSGSAYFANSSGTCQFSPALNLTSTATHWHAANGYDFQFIRNGSATSGTGRMKYNSGATSTFDWSMDPNNTETIIISNYDNVYTAANQVAMFTMISSNQMVNPTSFTAQVTYSTGTFSNTFSLTAGAL